MHIRFTLINSFLWSIKHVQFKQHFLQIYHIKVTIDSLHLDVRFILSVSRFIVVLRGLTDESEILKFLQHGTLVGLLPVPHPILIRKYQANAGTAMWFRTYIWGVIYLRYINLPVFFGMCSVNSSIRVLFFLLPVVMLTLRSGTTPTSGCLRSRGFRGAAGLSSSHLNCY